MLKFVTDPKESGRPVLVGLGLSFDNLRRLPADAIQFHASELGLGEGIFVIAHASDPKLGWYRSLVGSAAREVISLSDAQLASMKQAELLQLPLTATSSGRACQALIFAGETEEALLAAFKKNGLITDETQVSGPADLVGISAHSASSNAQSSSAQGAKAQSAKAKGVEIARSFRVGFLNKLTLIGGGLGFIVVSLLVMSASHHQDIDVFVDALMIGTDLVFWALLYLRWNERIETDSDGIRRVHPLGSFTLRWSDLSSASTKNDSLGPYELYLVPKSGVPRKLKRIYEEWDELIAEVQKHL